MAHKSIGEFKGYQPLGLVNWETVFEAYKRKGGRAESQEKLSKHFRRFKNMHKNDKWEQKYGEYRARVFPPPPPLHHPLPNQSSTNPGSSSTPTCSSTPTFLGGSSSYESYRNPNPNIYSGPYNTGPYPFSGLYHATPQGYPNSYAGGLYQIPPVPVQVPTPPPSFQIPHPHPHPGSEPHLNRGPPLNRGRAQPTEAIIKKSKKTLKELKPSLSTPQKQYVLYLIACASKKRVELIGFCHALDGVDYLRDLMVEEGVGFEAEGSE